MNGSLERFSGATFSFCPYFHTMIAEGVSPFKPNTTKKKKKKKTHSSIFTANIFVEHDKSPVPYDTEWSYTKLIALMHPILHPTHISYPTHTPSLPLPSPHPTIHNCEPISKSVIFSLSRPIIFIGSTAHHVKCSSSMEQRGREGFRECYCHALD